MQETNLPPSDHVSDQVNDKVRDDAAAVEALKRTIMQVLDDGKALDVTTLDVSELCSFTDHMVIASGTSNRHVSALVGQLVDELKKHDRRPLGLEGRETNEWVLVDYGDVVVHVMQRDARSFYDLERLWTDLEDGESATDP